MKKIKVITKHWLTIEEASKYLGVSQDTLRRWEKKGRLLPRRTMGGHRRYRRKQLEEILRQPFLPVQHYKTTSYQKKRYQKLSNNIAVPPTPTILNHQSTTISINKQQNIIDNLKHILPTLLIAIAIISLLIGSFILLNIATTTSQSEEQLISPLPQTKTLQNPQIR